MTTRLVLLGTSGGPTPKRSRSAPAQAVVVNDRTYMVDCGNGVARQMALAGLPLDGLRGIFITHHHSDHNADFGNLLLLSWGTDLTEPVSCYGPAPLSRMTDLLFELNATDIDIRTRDEGRPPFRDLVHAHEVTEAGLVYHDDAVTVTTTAVNHPPFDLALAYRFDTADRSIVISGDTTYSDNLIALARDADVLVHEVIYPPAIDAMAARSNGRTLRKHLLESHTSVNDVGKIAEAANVSTLVLSHLVPGDSDISDQTWRERAADGFSGDVIVGQDLLEV